MGVRHLHVVRVGNCHGEEETSLDNMGKPRRDHTRVAGLIMHPTQSYTLAVAFRPFLLSS